MFRIGLGTDIHPFEQGRKLFLGGIEIPHHHGLAGHSDADVVLHAIADALLGALALGDLGDHFPGTPENKDRPSSEILAEVCRLIWSKHYSVSNLDVVIMAEEPKINPYRERIREEVAGILNVKKSAVSVKATTCEKLGAIGRGQGIMAQAVTMLQKKEV